MQKPFGNLLQKAYSENLWINSLKFYCYFKVEGYRNILKISCRPLAFTYKAFFVKKRGLELVSLAHFLHNF